MVSPSVAMGAHPIDVPGGEVVECALAEPRIGARLIGGRQDPGDENLIATALRETEEELGIPARLIEVIGTLNPLNTVSRFEVLPVLGLLDGNYPLILSPDEVDHAFEVPLTHLLDRRNHIPLTLYRGGKAHTIYWIPWQQHFIWGATASMINQLAQHLTK